MALIDLAEATYPEVAALQKQRVIPVLPVGAVEAHGPHLPLTTDVIIARAMVRGAVESLGAANIDVLMLPALAYTAAPFAHGFSGTFSVSPETVTRLIVDISHSLKHHGFTHLAIANGHLDPAHIGSIYEAKKQAAVQIIYPDVTRKPWALRLSDEFKSGACHAGQYEGSIIMAERPDLVRDSIRKTLVENPQSLSVAIRTGKTSFEDAGGPNAYFGNPAGASVTEGHETIAALGGILAEAILSAFESERLTEDDTD